MLKSLTKKIGVSLAIGSFVIPAMISSVSSADDTFASSNGIEPRKAIISEVFSGVNSHKASLIRNTTKGANHLFDIFNTRGDFTVYLRKAPNGSTKGSVMYSATDKAMIRFMSNYQEPVVITYTGRSSDALVSARLSDDR